MTDKIAIGRRLKEAREKKGYTQADALSVLKVNKTASISAYERGEQSPTTESLLALAEFYDVSVSWLLYGDGAIEEKYKTNAERVKALLELTTTLGIPLQEEADFNGNLTGQYYFNVSKAPRAGLLELAETIYKYSILYQEGNLESEDYDILVDKKISTIAAKTNDFEPFDRPPDKIKQEEELQWQLNDNPLF